MDFQVPPVCPPLKNKFGHQLHSQYSMPCDLNQHRASRASQASSYQISHSMLDERIIYCQLSLVKKKDFAEEVRALLDVRKFVADSFILLDVTEVRIEAIVETIIDRLVECRQLGHSVAEEAKAKLFVERSSLSMVLANTMQGLYKSRSDGRLAYDHSWMVATCSLVGLQKRQVAIARFPHPINFGRHSQEVRFLIVVLTPSKEKLTKGSWETSRTFATMFIDIEFRRRLLRAKNQEEIKEELLARAESLSREQCNRTSEPDINSNTTRDDNENFRDQQHNFNNNNQVILYDQDRLKSDFNGAPRARAGAGGGKFGSSRTKNGDENEIDDGDDVVDHHKHHTHHHHHPAKGGGCCAFGLLPHRLASGLIDDLKRRSKFYLSDFTDGFLGDRSLYKTISTTIFLYFSVLLPCIAFGVVDTNNTDGHIDPKKTMIGQAMGGLFFALFSGQPLIVVMTTAPLCIYVKLIYQISQDLDVDFGSFYACVGLWMALFLVIFSITNASTLMKHCTRSTEDIFALFTAFAFGSDGIREAIRSFQKYYWEPDCATHQTQHVLVSRTIPESVQTVAHAAAATAAASVAVAPGASAAASLASNLTTKHHAYATHPSSLGDSLVAAVGHHNVVDSTGTSHNHLAEAAFAMASQTTRCQRETCILFLFLMCGTLWLANSFNSFNRTPYLSSRKREIIKDYALAISVLIFSFIGSYLFADIKLDVFEFGEFAGLHVAQMSQLSYPVLATACLLGFMASVLFYIDQNICGAMVNNAPYKLKKGNYFHLDLMVLAILNTFLSLTGLPWMHGKLPHSHLHSKALADYEERVDEGHIHQMIVNIRETRMTGVLVSILVALSLMAVPYPLSYIPLPVLSGVFLYTAMSEFKSNSLVERVCLLFTEQVAYPPNHYIRRCPQRKIHLFTLTQLVQLAIVSFIGFYPNPYVNMAFPLVVATFVPIRGLILPKLIDTKYLNSLDRASLE
uniref:Sodium bicarbonate transporter-like protein 11 n=1 Tax=Aceria tosichella TaxID=561515 RepID=A0A6G1S4T6_9ACAR